MNMNKDQFVRMAASNSSQPISLTCQSETSAFFDQTRRRAEQYANDLRNPKPPVRGVRVLRGSLVNGMQANAGDIVLIWPEAPPLGFMKASQVEDFLFANAAVIATDEEIQAHLAAQTPTSCPLA